MGGSAAECGGSSVLKSRLEEELERLKGLFGLGLELRVVWMPGGLKRSVDGNLLSGEVRGNVIIIYDSELEAALETLKHEFLDYVISHEIEEPYKELINRLIDGFEAVMYRRKERLIDRLIHAV